MMCMLTTCWLSLVVESTAVPDMGRYAQDATWYFTTF